MGKYLKVLGILEFIAVGIGFIVIAASGFALLKTVNIGGSAGAVGGGMVALYAVLFLIFAPAPGALLYAIGAIYDRTKEAKV